MSNRHKRTLDAIFSDPVSAGIVWADVERMLVHYGAVVSERAGSRVAVRLGLRVAVFHRPHPQKDGEEVHDQGRSRVPHHGGAHAMNYKGYIARVLYDGEEKVLRGRVAGIDDLVTFEARSVDELEREFRVSVDEYLAFCAEQRLDPQEPRSNPARMVDTERLAS
ncbi:MAG TPA: type II toxin-antitoxin system HicA family toxin [Longimicrobium sp.]|nr:type II toxin-antitoxin system HicA family toxin [Longimicrobium sp.]